MGMVENARDRWGWNTILASCALLACACGSSEQIGQTVGVEAAHRATTSATTAVAPTPPTGNNSATDDWTQSVTVAIANSEYRFRTSKDALEASATNRAQDLRGAFSERGLTLTSRLHPEQGEFSLKLASWGHEGEQQEAPGVVPTLGKCSAEGRLDENGTCLARLEYVRPGVVEYWDNVHGGMEQGWEIPESPKGPGRLILTLSVANAKVSGSPEGVTFETEGGFRVAYGALKAWDSEHHALHATLDYRDGDNNLRILVDDSAAKYPIVVDPILTTPTWSFVVPPANPSYGLGLSMAGGDINGDGYSDMVVGAPYTDVGPVAYQGMAFVFMGSATGLSQTASWTGTMYLDDYGDEMYGYGVAMGDFNGDGFSDVAVGAPRAYKSEPGKAYFRGAAYIYLGSSSGLAANPATTVMGFTDFCEFGRSLAAGDLTGDGRADLIVGAPFNYHSDTIRDGAIYVYRGTAAGLESSHVWTDYGGNNGEEFGTSIAIVGDLDGDTRSEFLVSSPHYATTKGRVYAYNGSGTGAFSAARSWTGSTNWHYGSSLAGVGDFNRDGYPDFMIGDAQYDTSGQADRGKVDFFFGTGSGFPTTASVSIVGDFGGYGLGASIAGLGDINGDGFPDVALGLPNRQQVWVYLGGAGTTSRIMNEPSYKLTNGAGAPADYDGQFGLMVAGIGDVNGDGFADIGTSAPHVVNNFRSDDGKGRAYVFLGAPDAPTIPTLKTTLPAVQGNSHFADVVAMAGDVNGDGYTDVLVGAPRFDDGQPGAGKAYLYLGSATGLASTAAWSKSSAAVDAHFGAALASAGDVNGDGYADFIIGAPDLSNGQAQEGRAYVFHGGTGTLGTTAAWTTEPDAASTHHGFAVASAGDVNGDGYGDVVVGGPGYSNGQTEEGSIRVYHGGASGLSTTAARTIESNLSTARFGSAVAAGDVNRDGYADVAVGSYSYGNGQSQEGRVSVFHGSSSGTPATANWNMESDRADSRFGWALATTDMNGDGASDLIVGAPGFVTSWAGVGRVYLYPGAPSTGLTTASWFHEGTYGGEMFGYTLTAAGDENGDGFGDFILGTPWDGDSDYQNATYHRGRIEGYYGGPSGPDTSPSWTINGTGQNAQLGISTSAGGDVNGDGYSDVIVGSVNADGTAAPDVGNAYLYLGAGSLAYWGPLPVNDTGWVPQARRTGTTTPLLPWNKAPTKAFDVRFKSVRLLSGMGRGKIWIDARPVGTAFGGGFSAGSWTNVAATGTDLLGARSGLAAATGYHYRARVVGDPISGGVPSATRWFYGVAGDSQGSHFRTP